VTLLVSIGLVSIPLLLTKTVFSSSSTMQNGPANMPIAGRQWFKVAIPGWEWRPPATASGQQSAAYSRRDGQVALVVQYVDGFNPGADVIGSSALFAVAENAGQIVGQDKQAVDLLQQQVFVDEAQIRDGNAELLAWSWYRVGVFSTSNNYAAKLQEARARLGFGEVGTYRIIVITPLRNSLENTREQLQEFVDEYIPLFYEELHRSRMGSS
jgi:EpsI family protein